MMRRILRVHGKSVDRAFAFGWARAAVVVTMLVGSVFVAAPPASASVLAVVMPAAPAVAAAAWSCPERNVCFWTGVNGTGSRCAWSVQDPDWTSGTMVCSWATRHNVKSIWNRGESASFTGVAYYLAKNYERRVGCTRQGARGNLTGTYKVLSHRWVTGTCG